MAIIKKSILSVFVFMLGSFLSGCTQADGYIGDWFGSWHLEEILINGEKDTNYNQDLLISFQGKIFKMVQMTPVADIYGAWEYEGEILTLDVSFKAGNSATNTQFFNPFPIQMYLPAGVDQVEITVTSINRKNMQWQYIDQNGDLLTYNLKKYPS